MIAKRQTFKFIDLPKNAIELHMKYGNIPCPNCNKKVPYAILCLVCGEKLCYMKNCCNNLGKNKNEMEYMYHTKICLNGEGIYLKLFDGKILASINRRYEDIPGSGIYLNKNGENFKGKGIGKEYVLNVEKYKNCLNEFKNMKYAKYFSDKY